MSSLDDVFNGVTNSQQGVVDSGPPPLETSNNDVAQPVVEDVKPVEPVRRDIEEDWTKALALDERKKRQELEAQIAELKASQAKPEKKIDIFEDPDGFLRHIDEQRFQDRVNLSREMMLSIKDDYEKREAEFLELMKSDPSLSEKLKAASSPAKFAYEYAMKAEKSKLLEDPDKYEAKIRADIEAKIRAEIEGELNAKLSKTANITPSLAKSKSLGGVTGSTWSGPTPLNKIL